MTQQQAAPNADANQNTNKDAADASKQGDQTKNTDTLLDVAGDAPNKDADGQQGAKYTPGVMPEGLDPKLWDAEKKTFKVDALYEELTAKDKMAKDLREKLGRRGAAPEKAEDYKIDMEGAEWKDLVKDDDALLKTAKEAALKAGIPQAQFGPLARAVMDAMYGANKDALENPPELTEEQKAEIRKAEHEKIGPNAPAVIRAVSEWARQMRAEGYLSEGDLDVIKSMSVTGDQIRVLNKMRERMGGAKTPMALVDAETIQGLPSDREIYDVIGSKEYQAGDSATHAKVEKWLGQRKAAGRPDTLQV